MIVFRIILIILVIACDSGNKKNLDDYSIATSDYAVLAQKALMYQSDFQLENWASMLAEDIEGNFIQNDKKNIGKNTFIKQWKAWKTEDNIKNVSFLEFNIIPIHSNKNIHVAGLSGVYVMMFCKCVILYESGITKEQQINFCCHFNKQKLIDRYYMYAI